MKKMTLCFSIILKRGNDGARAVSCPGQIVLRGTELVDIRKSTAGFLELSVWDAEGTQAFFQDVEGIQIK